MTLDSLENILGKKLYDAEVEDTYFNETYNSIILLSKKIIEDDSYRQLFYEIGKPEKKFDETTLEGSLLAQKYRDKKRFGPENTLMQILWNAQVPENKFDDIFKYLIDMIKDTCENDLTRKELYSIDLNNYKDDEEWN